MAANESAWTERLERAGVEPWHLRLYVAGLTPRSLAAFTNLKRMCEAHLSGRYRIEVVDLHDEPARAVDDQVIAVPTVVRKSPAPPRRVIGDLSDGPRTIECLGMEAGSAA